ncbi:hypothetical protein FRB90_005291, partial [Tulasnella sp. 427]
IKFSLPQATAIFSGLLLLSAVLALVLESYEDGAHPFVLLVPSVKPLICDCPLDGHSQTTAF